MPIDSVIAIIAILIALAFCGAALAWAMQTDCR